MKEYLENEMKEIELAKAMAESAKIAAEAAKIAQEARWYPLLAATGLVTAVAGVIALIIKFL